MSTKPAKQLTSSELPVAQPVYILRGHASAIHALFFAKLNLQLFSGDADGWTVIWSMTTKRPLAVWKAHQGAILGAQTWGDDRIITHGRDGRLRVWGLKDLLSGEYSTVLPVEEPSEHRKEPWIYHSLEVSSLTFCSFSACVKTATGFAGAAETSEEEALPPETPRSKNIEDILVAVPGTKDSSIEIFQLPSEKQVAMIPAPDQATKKTGMVMALKIFYTDADQLVVIAGYESGCAIVFKHVVHVGQWQSVYSSQPHSQPILSLDVTPSLDSFITSSADSIIAKHSLFLKTFGEKLAKEVQTRHSGQQSLQIRSDGKIFATSGWDARGRVYSVKTMKELAVLKWHKEGCYALAFGSVQLDNKKSDSAAQDQQLIATDARLSTSVTLEENRKKKAQAMHWLALGSKDGKISLWDIY